MPEKDLTNPQSIEEIYNSQTSQGESLRSLYKYENGHLVPRSESDNALNESLAPLNAAEKSYSDIIADIKAEREDYQKASQKQQKQNEKAQLWGGVGEVAAALTNIIGTTQGATAMNWASPQPQWAARADALIKEREAKTQDYRSQLRTLENARNQIRQRKATVVSAHNINNAKIATQAATAIAKAEIAANVKLSQNQEKGRATIANNARQILQSLIRANQSMGTIPNEQELARWSEWAYSEAVNQYRGEHPNDFNPLP